MSIFNDRYSNLNAAQRQAVDTIEGPVLVVAGPGTGKTEILALRIAAILRRTQSNPYNILALTFTTSGVTAMRKRLLSIIGATSYAIPIYTFHSFCNMVIEEWPEKFLFAQRVEPLTEVEKIRIVRDILTAQSFERIKPYAAPFYYQSALLDSIRKLKQEHITPEHLRTLLAEERTDFEQIEDLYHEKGRYKGSMKGKYRDMEKNWEKNQELCTVYEAYQQRLTDLGRYDYEDMILLVTEMFTKDEELCLRYQEQYQYILVDEYQDTSNAQNEVIWQLTSYWDRPNIFAVGDDDQSIYRFQGASLENILQFHQRFPDATTIVLTENYRSTQPILDVSRSLIEHNTERLVGIIPNLQKELVARRSGVDKYEHESVPVVSFPDEVSEQAFLIAQIEELLAKGYEPQDIAVLYRNNRDADALVHLLARTTIPFDVASGNDLLARPQIHQLIQLLRIIAAPHNDALYFEVLQYKFLGYSPEEVFALHHSAFMNAKEKHLADFLLSDELPERFAPFGVFARNLLQWQQASYNETFPEFLEKVMRESGFLATLFHYEDGDELIRAKAFHTLRSFFNNVETLGVRRYQFSLDQFLDDVAMLEESGVKLTEQSFSLQRNAVQLMTAHRAKGLEFPFVFLMQCYDGHWGNKRARQLLKLPQRIVSERPTADEVADPNEEERRLFYVAMTRAQYGLTLTTPRLLSSGRETVPSQFITDLDVAYVDRRDYEHEDAAMVVESYARLFAPVQEPPPTDQEQELMRAALETFALSPTSLNTYITCPRQFKYNNLIRIPAVKNKSAVFGSAIHYALEQFFRYSKKAGVVAEKDRLIAYFHQALDKELLSEVDAQETRERGERFLSGYYDRYADEWVILNIWQMEYKCSNVYLEDIPLKGIFDKVEVTDGQRGIVNVVDYKTGKPKTRNEILGQTKHAKGEYFRQLTFYKLLTQLKAPKFPFVMETGEIDFIQPKDDEGKVFVKERFEITDDMVLDLRETITTVWNDMQALKFPKKEKPDEDCTYCQYQTICWKV